MKLYVWYGVLTDYTSGVIFAMASSEDAARRKILADQTCERVRQDVQQPASEVLTGAQAYGLCWGGG